MKVEIPGQGRVLAHYGEEVQSIIHMEECAELIQAISKVRRGKQAGDVSLDAYNNLVEEVADVLICLEQIQEIYEIPNHVIQKMIYQKCDRQEVRMREHD